MTLETQLSNIHNTIIDAARKVHRDPQTIKLVAASKTQSVAIIRQAFAAGQHDFAENYVDEALDKMSGLTDLAIIWHFIGHIQSNKCKSIATQFAWVHSLDREKIAKRLAMLRPAHLPPLNVCIQVNIDKEPQKAGITCDQVFALAQYINSLSNLRLRGLMCLPSRNNFEEQDSAFMQLYNLFQRLQEHFIDIDTLSMGTSADYITAIQSGATMIRLGTVIFGERNK